MPANPYSSLYPNVPLPTQQTDPRQFAGSVISNYVKPTLPQGFGADANTTNPNAWHSMWQMLRQSPDFRFHMPGMDQIGQTLKANPNYQTYGPSHPSPKRPGLMGRISKGASEGRQHLLGHDARQAMADTWGRVGLIALGGNAALGANAAGAGAGAGGGVSGSAAAGGGSVAGAAGGVGAAAGGGAAMGAGGGMAAGGGNSMWPLLVSEGGSLLGGYMNKRATDKARNQQQQNIQNALAQLTPEAIQQLMRLFYTQNYAQMMPQMQGAQQGLAANAGRHGLTGSGVAQQLAAGIPGQFAQNALQSAQGEALGVAGQRASTLAGAPVTMPYSAGGDIQNMLSILSMYGLLKNNKQQAPQPANQNAWWIPGPNGTRQM